MSAAITIYPPNSWEPPVLVVYQPDIKVEMKIGNTIFTNEPYKLLMSMGGDLDSKLEACFKIAEEHLRQEIDRIFFKYTSKLTNPSE